MLFDSELQLLAKARFHGVKGFITLCKIRGDEAKRCWCATQHISTEVSIHAIKLMEG